jgi:hypothetical protein
MIDEGMQVIILIKEHLKDEILKYKYKYRLC